MLVATVNFSLLFRQKLGNAYHFDVILYRENDLQAYPAGYLVYNPKKKIASFKYRSDLEVIKNYNGNFRKDAIEQAKELIRTLGKVFDD